MAIVGHQSKTNSMSEFVAHPWMSDEPQTWVTEFHKLFESAVVRYQSGLRRPGDIFGEKDVELLASIGASPSEVYDYIEDRCEMGEPSFETVLGITSVRREYFIGEQQRRQSGIVRSPDTFPSGSATLGGFVWLPRIIAKARAKLRGELPPELMYGCPRDRAFLKSIGAGPAEFLQAVWKAGDSERHILGFVGNQSHSQDSWGSEAS